ncbi:MAG: MarR family transcriptional regulator, organic hydroperoxide resistance regulator [Actinomycetota bacterium]|nr:MarR family transcriptional regulator, organic hydroperoxide resistance regulator [Actinomycetota bacterium]
MIKVENDPESDAAASGMSDWPTGRLLSTAARTVEHAWAQALDARGLTHAGIIVLHLLADGPVGQADLARVARVQTQTMSRTIDRLERAGLVRRESDATDGRRLLVHRTDAGETAWLDSRTLEADMFPTMDDPAALRAALLHIIRAASDRRWSGQRP